MDSTDDLSEGVLLFEIAWEVARKIGGIYTVIRSKVPYNCKIWRDRYALIGVYNPQIAATEFEAVEPCALYATLLKNLSRRFPSLRVHFGRWLIPGYPNVFLFELRSSEHLLHQWREELMGDIAKPDDQEMNEFIIFGNQVAALLEEVALLNRKVIAQFHEYQAGVGLIVAAKKNLPIATVFTTHATLLGRYICAGRVNLYNEITSIDPAEEAGRRGIYHRHWVECESAHRADVFTTVSDITAFEAQYVLQRKVDIITPNGLNVERFTALHTFQNLHAKFKDRISSFIRGHFYGFYDFDIDKTLYFFTAGRAEYFNKGVNLYLDALKELNNVLKSEDSDITIVAFIIMPAPTNNFNVESLKGQSLIRDLNDTCNDIVKRLGETLFEQALKGEASSTISFSKEDEVMLKRRIVALKGRQSLPPIVTHNMVDDGNDEILNHLREIQLFNNPSDRVKIIYHPEFLSPTSTLLPLDYSDFVRGCHLGVFTSYYEPWGYTPAECTVLGVPSVTSNLTGFANFISTRNEDPASAGVYITDRRTKNYSEQVQQTVEFMLKFCKLTRRQRIELRNRTERLSEQLDWNKLAESYSSAYHMAFKKKYTGTEFVIPKVESHDDSLD